MLAAIFTSSDVTAFALGCVFAAYVVLAQRRVEKPDKSKSMSMSMSMTVSESACGDEEENEADSEAESDVPHADDFPETFATARPSTSKLLRQMSCPVPTREDSELDDALDILEHYGVFGAASGSWSRPSPSLKRRSATK
eukprot:CAMPEP_0170588352 /NCGR_PEP_ID=MMETSP0224-20130122/10782_1 /TAXON_ID=285029 /ORGANISM="Togula jolla, Strain CCCM 725" /LENGTH=139 /DNA_ID=CAMNT_0010912059 /DNA_START=139 /DNA_END=558 /DNA_ORIENTATION=+